MINDEKARRPKNKEEKVKFFVATPIDGAMIEDAR